MSDISNSLAWYIPHEIQNAINSNDLPIKVGSVGVVSGTSVTLGLTTELNNPRKEKVRLSAFPLELYNPEGSSASQDTIVTLQFPEVELVGQQTVDVTIDTQTVPIESEPELAAFLKRAYAANATTIGVRGSPKAYLGSLGYTLSLDKVVDFTGLASFAGMKITTLQPTAPADGNNPLAAMNGTLSLPNPSQLTLDLGDVQFSVSSGGVLVGKSWVNGLHVVPGSQSIEYDGELYIDEIMDKPANFTNFKQMISTLDDDGRVHFDIVGLRSYVNGEPIAYLDDVVNQIQLKVAPCYEVAQDAIPLKKQYMELFMVFDFFKAMECDTSLPLPDV